MTCESFKKGDATFIVCNRGARAPKGKPCSMNGCGRPGTFACDFPLAGAKAGKTCDRLLCRAHAIEQSTSETGTIDYCETHDRWVKRPKFTEGP